MSPRVNSTISHAKLRAMVPRTPGHRGRAAEALVHADLAAHALQPGDKAPLFELPDGDGMLWRSEELIRSGPLVIVFYRGRWCAYCNAQLAALQEFIRRSQPPERRSCISPQTQKHSYMTRDMHKLRFPVLSDAGNHGARKFGLVYRLPDDRRRCMRHYDQTAGLQRDQSWELPLAATYIVRKMNCFLAKIDADCGKGRSRKKFCESLANSFLPKERLAVIRPRQINRAMTIPLVR